MLGIFKSPPFRDSALGEFTRTRGYWRGTIDLDSTAVPLVLVGGRSQPDRQALELARTIGPSLSGWRTAIAAALFEHYEPYAEELAAGALSSPSTPFSRIVAPGEVWPHVTIGFVSVLLVSGLLTVEFGLTTDWDEEHTLGARFQEGKLLELCGSVLPP